jgi:hypothetical protein
MRLETQREREREREREEIKDPSVKIERKVLN